MINLSSYDLDSDGELINPVSWHSIYFHGSLEEYVEQNRRGDKWSAPDLVMASDPHHLGIFSVKVYAKTCRAHIWQAGTYSDDSPWIRGLITDPADKDATKDAEGKYALKAKSL